MQGVKPNPISNTEWSDGEILDPKNGKTYRCDIQLTDNGEKLNVRGYIGITLFGRSQTWERVNWTEEKAQLDKNLINLRP
jgi:uncharacterized protein (DUF2147 family)